MKASRMVRFALMSLAAVCLSSNQVLACACCADEGEYSSIFSRIRDYEHDVLKQIRFGEKALLFTTAADPEVYARGLTNAKDEYSLSGSIVGTAWHLAFSEGTTKGVLNLTVPIKMESYRVDTRDGQKSGGGGPLLYKEWRFEGPVRGTGLFKAGIVGPTRYFLVLQGRGNSCDNAEDFSTWRLEINGKKASYAFYGNLGKPK